MSEIKSRTQRDRDERRRTYSVVVVEQDLRSTWSKHSTLELARRAARKYCRANQDNDHWIDYEIVSDGRVVETVRW